MPRRPNKPDSIARAFGEALQAAREARGLSLEAVASRVATTRRYGNPTTLDPKYLRRLERGLHSPTVSTAVQLARALGITVAELMTDVDRGQHASDSEECASQRDDCRIGRATMVRDVPMNSRTLTRWVQEGWITPEREIRNGRRVQLFTTDDLRFARAVLKLMDHPERRGQLRLEHAVAIVRGEADPPDLPVNPASQFRPGKPE